VAEGGSLPLRLHLESCSTGELKPPISVQSLRRQPTITDILLGPTQLARGFHLSWPNPNKMLAYVKGVRKALEGLGVGAALMVPGFFDVSVRCHRRLSCLVAPAASSSAAAAAPS
jgi:hypothetical protein